MSEKRVALIIGASDATGGAIARRFAREDFTICVVRRMADSCQPLVAQIDADGGRDIHTQPRDAWTFEFDLWPWMERW